MRRAAAIVLLSIVALVGGIVASLWLIVASSRPATDGEIELAPIAARVEIARDRYGVPTLTARSRRDLAVATGFVHAQDRFFQMDVLRRIAAGELSALVGPPALGIDRAHRLHRFRARTATLIEELPQGDRDLLEAYAAGVNAGLDALRTRPFEYLLLRAKPQPWRVADTLLVNFAMYFDLNDDDASRDASRALLHEALSPALEQFLLPEGTRWDAPLIGGVFDAPPMPGPEVCNLASPVAAARARQRTRDLDAVVVEAPMAGSNAWTVGASRSETGRAIVANDMHLELAAPNIWYRMRLVVAPTSDAEAALDITGVTLPGAPLVVAGSNGAVAWGFTNSYGDWSDLVLLERDPTYPSRYRGPDGWHEFEIHAEHIEVRGGAPVTLEVRSTIWGPVIDADRQGRLRVVHWLAHEPEAANLRLIDLERAADVDAAIEIAHTVGSPPQNIMLGDRDGNTAWTIMGRIPLRAGYDPRLPASWADGATGWFGWLASEDYPVVKNPRGGSLWTANARTADGAALAHIGRGGYDLGARAQQIRDRLALLDKASIDDMLRIQLDDRAILEQRWRDLLLEILSRNDLSRVPRRAELETVLGAWDGRASPDAAGFRLTREFRQATRETLLREIVFGCGSIDEPFEIRRMYQTEGPVWRLATEQPRHLLPGGHATWDDFLLAMADAAIATCAAGPLADCSWGAINRVEIRHPLARALPPLAAWLTIHSGALPGGQYTPRVQQGRHGASERFAVSPGDEANGYFHMPGGQSGHPLSRFFRAGHDAWVNGERLPFLPGPPEHLLALNPAG